MDVFFHAGFQIQFQISSESVYMCDFLVFSFFCSFRFLLGFFFFVATNRAFDINLTELLSPKHTCDRFGLIQKALSELVALTENEAATVWNGFWVLRSLTQVREVLLEFESEIEVIELSMSPVPSCPDGTPLQKEAEMSANGYLASMRDFILAAVKESFPGRWKGTDAEFHDKLATLVTSHFVAALQQDKDAMSFSSLQIAARRLPWTCNSTK